MDVLMPDGTLVTDVPEGTTKSQLLARYNKFSASQPVKEAPVNSALSPQEQAAAAAGPFSGIASILSAPSKPRPIVEPTLSPEEQVMGAIGAPGEGVASLTPQGKLNAAGQVTSMTRDQYIEELRKRSEQTPERTAKGTAIDAGVTALKAAIGLPESFVGLVDIPTMGYAGKILKDMGYNPGEAKAILDTYLSEAQQVANRKVSEAEGFLPTIGAALQNPSVIASSIAESVPQMLGGVGVAKGVLKAAPSLSPLLAAAAGEGVLGAGSAAEQIRQQSKDELLSGKQVLSALGSGVGTAAFSVAGGKLANKLGVSDIDTLLVAGGSKMGAKSVADFAKKATLSGVSEGFFEEMPQSAQEQMWMNYATDKPIMEGVPEAAGMGFVTGSVMGGAATALSGRKQTPQEQRAQALADILKAGVEDATPNQSATDKAVRGSLDPNSRSSKNINIQPPAQGEITPPVARAKTAPAEEVPSAPADLAGLSAAPSESMDTDFMLREVMGEKPGSPKPTISGEIVEAPKPTEGVPSGSETVETQQAKTQEQQAPAAAVAPAPPELFEEAQKYDTPDLRLQQNDALGDNVQGLIYAEMESYGRAALKNRSLTEGYARKKDALADAFDAATIAFGSNDFSAFQPYAALFPKTAKKLQSHLEKSKPEAAAAAPEAGAIEDTPDIKSIRDAYTAYRGKDFQGSPELADFKIARLTDAANQAGQPINVLKHQGQIITLATSVEPPARAKLIGTINPTTAPVTQAVAAAPAEAALTTPVATPPAKKTTGASRFRSAAYDKNPLLTFLATHGLYHAKDKPGSLKSEFSPDKQIMVSGYGPVFKKSGKQVDELLPIAKQFGYLPDDATETDLEDLIRSAVFGKRVEPLYSEQGALNIAAQYEERMSRDREIDEERTIQTDAEWYGMSEQDYMDMLAKEISTASDEDFSSVDDVVFDLNRTPASNISVRSAMELLGFTEEEIQDEERKSAAKAGKATTEQAAQGDEPGQTTQAPADETLTATTPEGLRAEEERRNKIEAEQAKAKKDAEAKAKADEEVGGFTLTGSNRAADVTAAQGQKDIFAQEEGPIEAPQLSREEKEIASDGMARQVILDRFSPDLTAKLNKLIEAEKSAEGISVGRYEGKEGQRLKSIAGRANANFQRAYDAEFPGSAITAQNVLTFATRSGRFDNYDSLVSDNQGKAAKQAIEATDGGASPGYELALQESNQAIADFRKVQQAYRDQEIGDEEFLAARKTYDLAIAKYDKAFAKEQESVDEVTQAGNEEVLGPVDAPEAPQLGNEPYTLEGDFTEVGEEKQRLLLTNQSNKLTDTQNQTLEQQYGAKRGTADFLDGLRKDVIAFITQGATAVNGKIRSIIRQVANGVLSVAIVFNPQFVSKPYTISVPQYDVSTSEVIKELPKEAKTMSDAAKRAYGVIYPALEAQLKEKDKLFIVADKQSGNTYMFNPDGSLLLQSKTLFGKGIGDYMVGNNEIEANRITPAGVFDLGLRDAKRSAGEARTAGEYDFGKVFVLDKSYMGRNGPYSNTIMHSVWTNETDAKQRLAALNKPGADDSRYSFGCINVNKETFKYLVTNHLSQMDGAKIFIVPENGTNVMDFINGKAMTSDDIIRQRVEPVTKTTVTKKQVPAPKPGVERKLVGREEATKVDVKTEEDQEEKPKKRANQTFSSIEPESSGFKRWFGNSKVVDKAGNPLVVYHGTSGDFSEFSLGYRRDDQGNDQFGSGYYTTTSAEGASGYARGDGANVMPLFVSLQNPIDLDTPGFGREVIEKLMRASPEFKDAISNFGDINFSGEKKIVRDAVDVYEGYEEALPQISVLQRDFWPGDPEGFLKAAKKITGHDGVIVDNGGAGSFFVAWSPEQLKSATGNSGQYDPANPDIRYSIGRAREIEEGQAQRSPSLKRDLKTLNRMRKDGRITDEQFVERVDAAILADERDRLAEEKAPRKRGFLHIQKRLNEAVINGEISREARDLATWFMANNEDLVSDLGVSIIGKGKVGQGGSYSAFYRIATLIKSTGSDTTATHEILHHLERMMPPKIQQGIRKAWASQLVKAQKAAKTPAEKLYFAALMETHYGENFSDNIEIPKGAQSLYEGIKTSFKIQEKNFSSENLAQQLLIDAAVPLSNYEYFNPSEFWAVNGTDIVQARYEAVKGNTLARLKNWLKELGQKIKSLFGLKSDASIIRALDSLAKSDGKFVTKEMLGEGDYNQVIRNIRGNPAPTALWDSPDPSFMDGIAYQLSDKQVDTKRVIEKIQEATGQIDERLDAYTKESLYSSKAAAQIEDFLDDKFSPLFKKMRDENVTKEDLEAYLHNRHAEERNEQINKINLAPDVQDIGSGIATADARAYLSSLPANQKAKLKGLAAMVDDIIDGTQKILVDGGLETQETVDTWNKTYKHYIPLQRDDLDFVHTGSGYAGGVATKGSASKRAVGSIKPVKDILLNVAIQREKAIRRSEQAKVGRALYALAITNPNPGFWLPINPNAVKNKKKLIQEMVSLGLTIQDAENLIQEPKVPVIDEATGLVKYQVNPAMRASENVFSVRINGEDRFIIFNPKDERALRMARSLKNMDADELGWFLGNMGAVTRWIASVNTQYNPVFGAWNMTRDVQSAVLNLSTTELAGKEKEVLKGTMPALFAIYKDLRGKPAKNKSEQEYMDLFQQMRRAGGTTGFAKQFSGQTENFGNFMERMKTGKAKEKVNIVEQELKKLNQGNARKAAQSVFNWLSDYNDAMENAVRVSAFKVALQNHSEQKAASIAKELTVNFNRKGASSPTLQALYAFINASIQGSVRLGKTLRGPAGKKIIAGGITLGVVQALALALNGYDDGDPPEFLKDKNFIIPIPFAGENYAIIPMPLGFNVLPGIGRILTEAVLIQTGMLKSNKGVTDKVLGVGMLVLDAFNPLGAGSLTQMVTPTALDPIFAIAENKSAFGRPIYREDRDTQPTPGYQRSRDSATAVSQALAEFMNYVSSPSGSEYTKGRFSPTADEIDYLAGQYFGGVAREGIKLAESAKSYFTGEEIPAYRKPIIGKLYGETQSPAAVSSKFYDNISQMAKYENEIKKRMENNRPIDEYLENNPEASLWKRANRVESEVSKLNKTRSEYLKENDMENVKRIDEIKNEKMKMFNDSVKEAQ